MSLKISFLLIASYENCYCAILNSRNTYMGGVRAVAVELTSPFGEVSSEVDRWCWPHLLG